MDRDLIVEWPNPGRQAVERHGGGVHAAAEQVDLDQVGRALEHFPLLPQIQLAAPLARGLVARAEQFDRGHQALALVAGRADLDQGLAPLVMGHGDDHRPTPRHGRDGGPTVLPLTNAGRGHAAQHTRVGLDVPLRDLHPDSLPDLREVRRREPGL